MNSDLRRQTEEAVILRALQAIGTPAEAAIRIARETIESVERAREAHQPRGDKP